MLHCTCGRQPRWSLAVAVLIVSGSCCHYESSCAELLVTFSSRFAGLLMLCASKAYMMPEVCPPSWELNVCIGLGMHRLGTRDGGVCVESMCLCGRRCMASEDG
jgi:hypothetical protein